MQDSSKIEISVGKSGTGEWTMVGFSGKLPGRLRSGQEIRKIIDSYMIRVNLAFVWLLGH